jgi:hypothetical protein
MFLSMAEDQWRKINGGSDCSGSSFFLSQKIPLPPGHRQWLFKTADGQCKSAWKSMFNTVDGETRE